MPNILKRAFDYFGGSSTDKQITVVSDRNQYFNNKVRDVLQGTSKFDFTHPELCSTVYTCVSLIANNISKLDLKVYKQTPKGREVFADHPWQQTLSINPDLRLSTSKWLAYTVTRMLIEGTSYYLISDYDLNLNPKRELKPLDCVKQVVAHDGEVFYQFEGLTSWIPSKQLLIFYPFSRDGVTGLSPIAALRNELNIQHGSEQTITNFYKNGLFQLLYLESDLEGVGQADKNKLQEYYDRISNEITGSQNAFAGGLLKVPPMYKLRSIALPDLKFLESSKFTESRVAGAFNVPSYMLNINEGTGGNYMKTEAQQLHFLNNCLSNITNILRQELTYKLLTVDEITAGISIDFDYSTLFTLDLESKSVYLKNVASMGGITPNEIRVQFGMEKVDNEFMDYNYLQSQNQAIQQYDKWGNKSAPITNTPAEGSNQAA